VKSVYEFLDYRQYLKYFYGEKRKTFKFFSHRFFLRKAGIKNTGFFTLIVEGKRNLTRNTLEKFSQALDLKDQETKYFQNLVLFNQAKTANEKQEFYANLKHLGDMVHQKVIGSELYEYFSNWYTPVIRELICLHDFQEDFETLAQAVVPAIPKKQAKKSVQFLIKSGMIKKLKEGTYKENSPAIIAGKSVSSLAIRNFNRQMINLAINAQDRFPQNRRYVRGLTIGISGNCYDLIEKELEAVNNRIVRIVDQDENSNQVYQINIQLFPVSTTRKNKGKE